MAKLNDLGLTNEALGGLDFGSMPEQRGSYGPPLYPGTYRFKLPLLKPDLDIWDHRDTDKGPRLVVKFEGASALTIVGSPSNLRNGESFEWNVSNQEFNRARQGEPDQLASDLDFLLRDGFKIPKRPATNLAFAQALIALSGKEFTADNEWTWYCNSKRDIYQQNSEGGSQVVEGVKGCGSKYYQARPGGSSTSGVQKSPQDPSKPVAVDNPLVWPERIVCSGKDGIPCGAVVRAFPNLRNFRP
jgi:hypothetical protein